MASVDEVEEMEADELELEESELEAVGPAQGPHEGSARPARPSVPPPLPPELRQHASGSRSGTWRISQPPDGEPSAAPARRSEADARLDALERQSREQRAQIARLRLQLKLRDDRIALLEGELAQVRARADELERLEAQRPPDDLKRIDGIGPAYERALRELGVRRIAEIAGWGDGDVERVAEALGTQPARVQPWIARAAALA